MVVEGPKLHGLTTKQLNNRNFTEELTAALNDGVLTKKEAQELYEIFKENGNKIYDISRKSLKELRKHIHSLSRHGWVTDRDLRKLEFFDGENTNDSQKSNKENEFGYNSIDDKEELKKLFDNGDIKKSDIDKFLKWRQKTVRIHYKNGKTDRIVIKELKAFYENEYLKLNDNSANKSVTPIEPVTPINPIEPIEPVEPISSSASKKPNNIVNKKVNVPENKPEIVLNNDTKETSDIKKYNFEIDGKKGEIIFDKFADGIDAKYKILFGGNEIKDLKIIKIDGETFLTTNISNYSIRILLDNNGKPKKFTIKKLSEQVEKSNFNVKYLNAKTKYNKVNIENIDSFKKNILKLKQGDGKAIEIPGMSDKFVKWKLNTASLIVKYALKTDGPSFDDKGRQIIFTAPKKKGVASSIQNSKEKRNIAIHGSSGNDKKLIYTGINGVNFAFSILSNGNIIQNQDFNDGFGALSTSKSTLAKLAPKLNRQTVAIELALQDTGKSKRLRSGSEHGGIPLLEDPSYNQMVATKNLIGLINHLNTDLTGRKGPMYIIDSIDGVMGPDGNGVRGLHSDYFRDDFIEGVGGKKRAYRQKFLYEKYGMDGVKLSEKVYKNYLNQGGDVTKPITRNISKGKPIENTQEKDRIISEFNDLLFPDKNLFEEIGGLLKGFINLFRNKADVKQETEHANLIRVLNRLTSGGKDLKTFQEFYNLSTGKNIKVDGKWGNESFNAFKEFLKTQGTSFDKLKGYIVAITWKRQYELQKIMNDRKISPKLKDLFGEGGIYEGQNEKTVRLNAEFNKDFNDYFYLNNRYGRLYKRKTERLKAIKFPERLEKINNLFLNATLNEFRKQYPRFNRKKFSKLKREFPKIRKYASLGYQRAVKNLILKGKKITDKNPITIYVPNKDRGLSMAFTYNPLTKKIEIKPFGYSYKGFSNRDKSKQSPLGTFKIGRIRRTRGLYDHSSLGGAKSPRGAAMDTIGIESGLNDRSGSSQGRGTYSHGVSSNRSYKLNTGLGTTSWGCRVYTAKDARKNALMYKKQINKGYAAYEEVLPTIKV